MSPIVANLIAHVSEILRDAGVIAGVVVGVALAYVLLSILLRERAAS